MSPATERIPVVFRATTSDAAVTMAKAWAKAEGIRVRTVARVERRDDIPAWSDPDSLGLLPALLQAWQVTLAVDAATLRDALP